MNKCLGFLLYIFYSILEEKIVQQSKVKCLDSMKDRQNFLSFIINRVVFRHFNHDDEKYLAVIQLRK